MYCPNCGKENSSKQRFCRSCGLSLQAVSQALAVGLPAAVRDDESLDVLRREQKSWHNPLLYGFLMLALGLLVIVLGKKVFAEQLVADIGTLISVLGVGLLGFRGVMLMQRQSRPATASEMLPAAETTAAPTAELTTELQTPPAALNAGEPPSITEHTTRHFEPVYTKRKAE